MHFSVGEGLRRAVKNRLRSTNKGSEADLDWRAQELAGSMRPYVNDHAIAAEMYLFSTNRDGQHSKKATQCSTSPGFIVAPVGTEAKPSAKGGCANRESSH